jgi:N-acetylglucosamine malate deacetylase 1
MNVVVIAPHPDDEAIGCGGTICLHTDGGDRVTTLFLTSGEMGLTRLHEEEAKRVREREAESAAEVLGLAEITFLRFPDGYLSVHIAEAARSLRPILEREMPELVYLPHDCESHPDHAMTALIVRDALDGSIRPSLVSYEVWTPLYEYNYAQDISTTMARKLRAIRRYRSQNSRHHFDRSSRELNRYRGHFALARSYAEAFHYREAAR